VALCPVMVGRDDELRLLEDALAGSAAGKGAVVFVTGEPGIGKSRLVRELTGRATRLGALAVTGRAVPAESGRPYRPLTEALLQILRDRPLPGDADLAPWLPALRAMLPGIGGEEHGDASSVARGEAVIRLIRRLGMPDGLLITLEDLHWADPDTLAAVEYLADNLAGERVLCVATSRSEPPSAAFELARRLENRRGAMRISLGRLGDDKVAQMVRACTVDWDDQLVARVQRAADGVPFLVEEVLASPGVPESFTGMVRARLAGFADDERRVLEAAAVLGRHFDWQLLGAATGLEPGAVSGALERAVGSQLLTVDGEVFRFRHALTREAVAAGLLPPRRRSLAASALAAVDAAHPELRGAWRDVAADLAAQAGDIERAGTLLAASGEAALDRGALATAADTLRRAAAMLADPAARASAEGLLVGCLALAGNADEAMAVGERLIASSSDPGVAGPAPADIHIRLASAAIAATRWPAASAHVEAARRLLAADPRPERGAHLTVLGAELALACEDVAHAGKLAHAALDAAGASPEVQCQALEVIGRIARLHDLGAARGAFERALAVADAGHLPFWRLRALHELGTIELFDSGGTERLSHARRAAAEAGAFSTVAVLDLQLAAAYDWRFEFGESTRHARLALAAAQRLGMSGVQAKALLFLAEAHAMRQDLDEMERCLRQAALAAPDDRSVEAFGWGGCRAMSALFRGDLPEAMDAFGRSMSVLRTLPHAEPAMFRALWPLVLAAAGDSRAGAVLAETRRTTVTVARFNRGALGYAEAILAGCRGDRDRAAELARTAGSDIGAGTFGHLARLFASEPALCDGWGEPARWLESAHADFTAKGFGALAAQCRALLQAPAPDRLARLGVTPREADVLLLVAEGLPNKEIAARLQLSPRTVEKHVESLLRKTGARSRTKLVVIAGPFSAPGASLGT
jgi:DNA-binding CsgD family transcriptional regulator/tetratricopeptide (TPR) repeat protein